MKKILIAYLGVALLFPLLSLAEMTEDAVQEMEKRQETILKTLYKLQAQGGLLYSGRVKLYINLDEAEGNAVNTNVAVRQNNSFMQADLQMDARPMKGVTTGWILRFRNNLGEFWGGLSLQARELYCGVDLFDFIHFDAGFYRANLSPLTFWASMREFPFEPEIFLEQRKDEKIDAYFNVPNKWTMKGLKMNTGLYVDNVIDKIYIDGFASFLSENPDRLMASGKVNLLRDDGLIDLSGIFSGIYDLRSTLTPGRRDLYKSTIMSLKGSVQPVKFFSVFGEAAMSTLGQYTNAQEGTPFISCYSDTALQAGVKIDFLKTTLKASYISVGNEYFAPAAQTPVYDISSKSAYSGDQNLRTGFMERAYATGISFTRIYNHGIYLSQPMDVATPNREGFIVDLHSSSLRYLEVDGGVSSLREIRPISCAQLRNYLSFRGGAKLDMKSLLGIRFLPTVTGFYFSDQQNRNDDVQTPVLMADETEDINVTVFGAGIELPLVKNTSLMGGYEQLKSKGRYWGLFNRGSNPLSEDILNYLVEQDRTESVISVALLYNFQKNLVIRLEYNRREYHSQLVLADNYVINTMRLFTTLNF